MRENKSKLLTCILVIMLVATLEWLAGWYIYDQYLLWQKFENTAYKNLLYSLQATTVSAIALAAWLRYKPNTQTPEFEPRVSHVLEKPKKSLRRERKTKPKYLIIAFASMFAATLLMAYVTVQAQTQNQYITKPWFVTVYEVESTLKGHLIQTEVNFETWRYTSAKILVKNEGAEDQACSINVLLQNENNATIAKGDLEDTGLIPSGLTAEHDVSLTWMGTANITDSRNWFIGTTPKATQLP